jgi:hypothetical protein
MESTNVTTALHKDRAHMLTAIVTAFLCVAFLILSGCMVKDKSGNGLRSGDLTPPWDSTHFNPQRLEGYVYPGPESTFSVFGKIAKLDSLCGNHAEWKADPKAMDTLRINQLYDTGFLFPENPEATMAYGFDDTFRDDTLYRKAFGNGLFTQDNPCAATTILSGEFLHPAKWLRAGLTKNEVVQAMGTPLYNQTGVLRYFARHKNATASSPSQDSTTNSSGSASFDVFEGANLYFQGDSLFAAMLQKSQPCH